MQVIKQLKINQLVSKFENVKTLKTIYIFIFNFYNNNYDNNKKNYSVLATFKTLLLNLVRN